MLLGWDAVSRGMWGPPGDVKYAQRPWGFRGCGLFQEAEEKGIAGEHSQAHRLAAGRDGFDLHAVGSGKPSWALN